MSGLTNVAGVIALADDSWVEGGFEATVNEVRQIQKKDGTGSFFAAKLSDGGGGPTLDMTLFTAPKFTQGDKIRVAGQGIKKGSYNGKPQVKTGMKVGITVVASGGNAPAAAPTAGASSSSTPAAQGTPVAGETVGNALTNLTRLYVGLRALGLTPNQINEEISANAFKVFLFEGGSTFIRGGRALCSGKLSPNTKEHAPTPTPAPQSATHNPEKELDSDCPF